MRMVRRFAVFLLPFVLIACTQGAAPDKPASAPSTWLYQTSDLPVDKAVRYGQLQNGMRYALAYNDQPKKQISMRFSIKVGSINEAEDQRGLAHFIEHMAFNGSQNVAEGEMVKLLERKGLAFGADTNASTGSDYTVYQLDLPQNSDELIDTGLFLFRETADKLTFNEDAIERERGVVFSEYRRGETPQSEREKASDAFLFPHALSTYRNPIGLPKVIKTAPRARFIDLYQHYYRPERAILVIVGDMDVDDMEARIKKTFGDWQGTGPAGPEPKRGYIEERGLEVASFQHKDVATSISIGRYKKPVYRPDTIETRKKKAPYALANAILSRRLGEISRSADAGFLGAGASGAPSVTDPDFIAMGAVMGIITEPKQWRRGLITVQGELRKALTYGFTQAEVDEQIANTRRSLQNAADQADTRWSQNIANGILNAYTQNMVFTNPKTMPARFEAVVPTLTPQNLVDALRAEWAGGEPLIFIASSEAIKDEDIRAAWKQAQAQKIVAPEKVETQVFAYTDFGEPGKIVWRNHIDDMDIDQIRFANNVMVNFKHTDFKKGQVLVGFLIGDGFLSQPADKPGLWSLADNAFVAGGLEAHTIDELSRLAAGHTLGLGSSISENTISIGGPTTPEDLDFETQVLVAYLTHAAWREAPLASFYKSLDTAYQMRDATPDSVSSWQSARLIHNNDNRWGWPEKAQMKALKISDARAWFGEIIAHASIEISVVGDADKDQVFAALAKTFGTLPVREAKPRSKNTYRPVTFPTGHGPAPLTHKGKANLGNAQVYWPTTDNSDARLSRTAVLARAVIDLKLTERVREKEGGAYSPSAFDSMSSALKGYGYMGVNMNVEPEKIDHFFDVADDIVADLANGKITQDELLRARKPILEMLEKKRQGNTYWYGLLSSLQSDPQTLANARSERHDYETLGVSDIQSFAKTYLQPDRAYRISIVPQDKKGP